MGKAESKKPPEKRIFVTPPSSEQLTHNEVRIS
jgi:hypothetical protein